MKLQDFDVLTFDCYGTLIDWETGIWNALQPLLSVNGTSIDRETALETFATHETDQERMTPSLANPTKLSVVHARLAQHWGIRCKADLHERFGASVADWPAFPDSAEALSYLKRHYKLVILSNIDNKSFDASRRKLGVAFDAVYTAEDIGSYKPDPANFSFMIRRLREDLGIEASRVLHTAQSLHHDHVPASAAGLARAWINRRAGKIGGGATAPVEKVPSLDFTFKTMGEMAAAHSAVAR